CTGLAAMRFPRRWPAVVVGEQRAESREQRAMPTGSSLSALRSSLVSGSPLSALRSSLVLMLLWAVAAHGQEPIRFARTPDTSPDGKLVAFSYLGDIWVVESIGGTARQVTRHIAHNLGPVFSPDGRTLAYSSNRHGHYDVFTIPVRGGK